MNKSEKLSIQFSNHLSGGDFNPAYFRMSGFVKVIKDKDKVKFVHYIVKDYW